MSAADHQAYLEELARAERLIEPRTVARAVASTARGVHAQLAGRNPLLLCVMIGGFRFASDLSGHLDFALELDPVQVTRYRERTCGGELSWRLRPAHELRGRSILIVDDVLDEGITLETIRRYCVAAGARETWTAVLVDKCLPARACEADFAALQAPDRYLFGEGMDFKGYGRNLRGIYALGDQR